MYDIGTWLELLKELDLLLKTDWKTFEELKKLRNSALKEYCASWDYVTFMLGQFVHLYEQALQKDPNRRFGRFTHRVYQQMKSLSPAFTLSQSFWLRDHAYVALHPRSKIKRGDVYVRNLKIVREWLNDSRRLKIDRLILELIAEEIRAKVKSWLEDMDLSGRSLAERFTFRPGQVLFDGGDLNIRTGIHQETLKKLVENFGKVVQFRELDSQSKECEASVELRGEIRYLREKLKKLPVKIENRRGEGYMMCPND